MVSISRTPCGASQDRAPRLWDNPDPAKALSYCHKCCDKLLYQMWGAPEHRAMGAGQMLLQAVIAWARATNSSYLALVVTCGNGPAMRLYARVGFQPVGEPEPLRSGSELLAQPMRLALRTAELFSP